ncbi:preprotein translocase subunit SecG [Patescibacteria group bacterium]|nr:preprotein translocase subunit SecG [Patescibacteria group bacterium]
MRDFVQIFQMVVAILLILSILSQQRSAGLSATFGGTGGFQVSKRGAEKVLFIATIVLAVLFVGSSVLYLFV